MAKLTDEQIVSAISGVPVDEVERQTKLYKPLTHHLHSMIDEIDKVSTSNDDYIQILISLIETMLIDFKPSVRFYVLMCVINTVTSKKYNNMDEEWKKFKDDKEEL